MGLAEDLKALQELREKGELSEAAYKSARDSTMRKHGAAPTGAFHLGRLAGFILLPLLAIVILWAILFVVNKSTQGPGTPTAQQRSSLPTIPFSQPQPRSVAITNGALTVAARSFSWYPFTVPANASTVTVNGHFAATGGAENDIIVYVTDEDGFVNLKNGLQARVYFNSQKVSQSSITAVLPNTPGTYYLFFDNRFSFITPKAVEVNATLSYMQ